MSSLHPQHFNIEPQDYANKTGYYKEQPGAEYQKSFEPISEETDLEISQTLVNDVAQFSNIEKGESIAATAKKFLHPDETLLLGPDGSILLCSDVYIEDPGGVQFVMGDAEGMRLPFNATKRNSASSVEDALKKRGYERSGPIHMQACHIIFTNKRALVLDVSFYSSKKLANAKTTQECGPSPSVQAADLSDNFNQNMKYSKTVEMKKARAEAMVPALEANMSTVLIANFRTFRSIWLGADVIDVGLDMSSAHQAAFHRFQGTDHTAAVNAKLLCGQEEGVDCMYPLCDSLFTQCLCFCRTCCEKEVEKKAATSTKLPVEVKRRDYLSTAEDKYRRVHRLLNISTLRHGEVVILFAEEATFDKVAAIVGALSPTAPPEAFYTKQPGVHSA